MPCYLRGRIKVTDLERLRDVASNIGLEVRKVADEYHIFKDDTLIGTVGKNGVSESSRALMSNMLVGYSVAKVKQVAQKRGWKVTSVTTKEDRVIVRVSE